MEENKVKFDLESRLREYMPSLFTLIGNRPFGWNNINKIAERNFEKRSKEYWALQNDDEIIDKRLIVEANLYDVIGSMREGDDFAKTLFTYFDLLLQHLGKMLSTYQKDLICTTLKGFLIDTDKNYRNYIGELAVLNNCLNGDFDLVSLEEPMPNGKKIDFNLKHKISKKTQLVEVLNIHYNYLKEYTDDTLALEIKGKIIDKLKDKTKNDCDTEFYLVPVIWANYEQLKWISSLYADKINIQNKLVIEPSAFGCFTYPDGSQIYKFGTLSSLVLINEN